MTRDEIRDCAARIARSYEEGRCCREAGAGLRMRALHALCLVSDGLMTLEEAGRIAAECENVALAFPSLLPRAR